MSDTTSAVSKENYLKKYLSEDSVSAKPTSKVDYLKKYTSGHDPTAKQKKKRRKKVRTHNLGYKIIDDDIDVKNSASVDASDNGGSEDEVPFVVSVEDEANFKMKLDPRNWITVGSDDSQNQDVNLTDSTSQGWKKHDSSDSNSTKQPTEEQKRIGKNFPPSRTSVLRHDSGSDQSPPRTSRARHNSDSDQSLPRTRVRHDSDSDQSLPRTSRTRHDSDGNSCGPRHLKETKSSKPQTKRRHDSDSDQSPPRKTTAENNSGSDLSPPRASNKRHDSDSDVSVPRKSRPKPSSDSDQSPPRSSRAKDSLSNLEMNRAESSKNQRSSYSSRSKYKTDSEGQFQKNKDNSRRERSPTERKPSRFSSQRERVPTKNKKPNLANDSDGDLSPPRSSRERRYDRTPPRLSKSSRHDSPSRGHKQMSTNKDDDRPEKTLSGLKAGLQSAKILRTELEEAKAKERDQFKQIDDGVLGKGAQTVFRDRSTGKLRDLKKEGEEEQMKKAKEDEMKAKYNEWGKGVKQQDDRRKQILEEQYEMSKPLARYEGDHDLEKHLREQEREGDPMLQFIRKKKLEGKKTLPTYQGPPPPPNRFNIMPGYRWDGVDRSNGFEKKLFDRQSNKIALEEEAYKWSIENM